MADLQSDVQVVRRPGGPRRVTGLVAALSGVLLSWLLAAPRHHAADGMADGRLP